MNTPIWQRLPEAPPTEPRSTDEDQTVILDRDALAGPPPAPSPLRDSNWWRAGAALLLVAALGGVAWLVSNDSGDVDAFAGSDVSDTPTGPLPGDTPDASRPGLDSFFADGSLPPEIEQLLRDFDRFRADELPPGFDEFFGPDGRLPSDPFAPGGPFSEDSRFFERFFSGSDLPPEIQELLDRLPEALSGRADAAPARDLIDELLADPDLPEPLRRMLERIESGLPADS